jgi:hypothetical protein
MNDRDRFVEVATELARAAQESGRRARHIHRQRYRQGRRRRRGPSTFMRWLNAVLLMFSSAVIIPVVAVSVGLLLGKHWYAGLIASPLAVLAAWAVILFFALRKRVTRRTIAQADITRLPEQTGEWLEGRRPRLPSAAQSTLESIAVSLEGLAPQVKALDASLPEAVELRRLIGEELPALVEGYQKLPDALRRKPLHDGPTPEQRLIDGLETIDAQLSRVHQRLADGDLFRLATHQRYLELKYKDDDKLE